MKKFLGFQQEEFKELNENIIGVGIDIEPISRFKNIFSIINSGRLNKLFYPSEIEYCKSSHFPERELAKFWCLKEATVKAFSGICELNIFDVEIKNLYPVSVIFHSKDEIITNENYKIYASFSIAERIVIAISILELSKFTINVSYVDSQI